MMMMMMMVVVQKRSVEKPTERSSLRNAMKRDAVRFTDGV